MTEKRPSPFDSWFPPQHDERQQVESAAQEQPGWGEILHEAGKTWKSISPLIQPFVSKFK